ncbi:Uncharacterized protein ALO94_02664 [Pseudomonas syringae pv. spinaceae]|uniref:Uncharacterized protein n=1 Tax=Pseudomonas syringae pv. spinaceae TaxID=264459 RepID=A0A0N8T8U7_PSESX|nr:Uncharacterized protein ALO94_02664 [Pseudomonas syringae pv. spinaceae]
MSHRLPVFIEGNDAGAAGGRGVTGELRGHIDLDQTVVVHAERAGRTCTHALGFHFALKALFVQRQVTLTGDVTCQVHRETVGVIQLEHDFAGNHGAFELGQILLDDLQALFQGLGELLFFASEDALDVRLLLHQFRECRTHLGDQRGDDLVEEAALGTELVTVTAGATNDAAQHIATAFAGRQYAIGDQEAARTNVVSHDFQRSLVVVAATDGIGRCGKQALKQVDFVVGMHVLQNGTDPLKTHAGIDRRRWQRVQHAISGTVELHKNVVPDFNVTVAVLFWRAWRATPDVRAVVEENLAARATRAGVAHGPEVVGGVRRAFVVTDANHAFGRDADLFGPDIVGFVVGRVDGDPEFFLGQVQPLLGSQEGPGVGNGITLEIVTKAEVTQHFEKSVVTSGIADVFQVVVLATGTHAFLTGHGAGVGAFFLAQEAILELVHACVGEQQGWVIARNQGA